MAVVTFKIAGVPYKIACADGKEEHIQKLAMFLDTKASTLTKSIGYIPEGQLLAMVNILVAEELFLSQSKSSSIGSDASSMDLSQVVHFIDSFAIRVSELADILKKSDS